MTVGQPENLVAMLTGATRNRSTASDSLGFRSGDSPQASFQSLLDASSYDFHSRMIDADKRPRQSTTSQDSYDSLSLQTSYVASIGNNNQPAQLSPDNRETQSASSVRESTVSGSRTDRPDHATVRQEGGTQAPRGVDSAAKQNADGSKGDGNQAQSPQANNLKADGSRAKGAHAEKVRRDKSAAGKSGKASSQTGKAATSTQSHGKHSADANAVRSLDGQRVGATVKRKTDAAQVAGGAEAIRTAGASVALKKTGSMPNGHAETDAQAIVLRIGSLPGKRASGKLEIGKESSAQLLEGTASGKLPKLTLVDIRKKTQTEKGMKAKVSSPAVKAPFLAIKAGIDRVQVVLQKKVAEKTKADGNAQKQTAQSVQPPQPKVASEVAQELTRLRQLSSEQSTDKHDTGNSANSNGTSQGLPGLQASAPNVAARPPVQQAQTGAYAALARQLKEGMNGDIVREAKVVLKDNNSGEIRMTLRPESLGRVRIQLHVVDNRIGGRIFVDNMNVKDVFQQNLNQLYQAFQASGFETGMLEVAVGNGGDQTAQQDDRNNSRPGTRRVASVGAIETAVPRLSEASYGNSLINLVV